MERRRYGTKKVWNEEGMERRGYGTKRVWSEEGIGRRGYGTKRVSDEEGMERRGYRTKRVFESRERDRGKAMVPIVLDHKSRYACQLRQCWWVQEEGHILLEDGEPIIEAGVFTIEGGTYTIRGGISTIAGGTFPSKEVHLRSNELCPLQSKSSSSALPLSRSPGQRPSGNSSSPPLTAAYPQGLGSRHESNSTTQKITSLSGQERCLHFSDSWFASLYSLN
jgi:hypothetical protein